MKTEILDTPIIENINDLLTTGECIVWEGESNPEKVENVNEVAQLIRENISKTRK